jgi:predicted MFS family arabinose efflux permease
MVGSVYVSVLGYTLFELSDGDWRLFNTLTTLPGLVAAYLVFVCVPPPLQQLQPAKLNFAAVFSAPQRQTTLSLQAVWFGLSFSSFGILAIITPLFSDIGIASAYLSTVIFSSAALVANVASYLLLDLKDRRTLLSSALFLSFLSGIFFAFVQQPPLIVLAACLFQIATTLAWNVREHPSERMCERAHVRASTCAGGFGGSPPDSPRAKQPASAAEE